MKTRQIMRKLSMGLVLILLVTSFSISDVVYAADEYDTLRTRFYEFITGGSNYDTSDPYISAKILAITDKANEFWSSLNTDPNRTYLWSDLQYGNDVRTNDIYTSSGYQRLNQMALAYRTHGSSLLGNTTLRDDIIDGLEWLYVNRYNENSLTYEQEGGHGFKKAMGTPYILVRLMTLMYDDLTSTQIDNYCKTIDHFMPDVRVWIGGTTTGANRSFACNNIMLRGIIGKNSDKIVHARDNMGIVYDYVTSGDGMYVDGSFVQHRAHAYNGNYGRGLLRDCVFIEYMLSDSTWELTDPDSEVVYDWVYNAFEPLIYDGYMFDDSKGRTIAGAGSGESIQTDIISAILNLSLVSGSHQSRLQSMVKQMLQTTPSDYYSLSGITQILWARDILNDSNIISRGDLPQYKQYASMDFVAQQRPEYAVGISMHSDRMYNYEISGDQNLKGWHQGDGWLQLLNGDYYGFVDVYYATVDAYRMPGTTVNHETTYHYNRKSDKSWVGGTDIDDLYGVTGMELHPNGQSLTARKSWFMFDNEVICLGSGINATDSKMVETIVENKMINSAGDNTLTVDGIAKSTSLSWTETMSNINWAHIQGNTTGADVGYYFPGGTSVNGLREARVGSWDDVSGEVGVPTTDYTRNYLTLWLEHGVDPSSETYQYALLPGMASTEVQSYASSPDFSLIANTHNVHAVKEDTLGIVAANFWEDGTNTADIITVDKKASVITSVKNDYIDISVADPTQSNNGTINVEIGMVGYGVLPSDSDVTVLQLEPTIKLAVDVSNSKGYAIKARISTVEGVGEPIPGPKVNLAQGKSYNASSNWSVSYVESKAFDVDESTRWSAGSGQTNDQWIEVDFGGAKTYNQMIVKEMSYQRVTSYKLQKSHDGVNYTDIPGTEGTTLGGEKMIDFATETSRYLRLYINSASNVPTINEIEVYLTDPTVNLTLNGNVTVSNYYQNRSAYDGNKGTDGDLTTRWATDSGLTDVWLEVDFGEELVFNKSVFKECTNYGQRIDSYRVQYWDGSSWVDIITGTIPASIQEDTFSWVCAQKVRLYLTDNDQIGPTVWEFEVYNQ